MVNFEFEVGKQYRNRIGQFTVLELRNPKMLVRYDDGNTVELTIEQQAKIYQNILLEEEVRAKAAATPPPPQKVSRTPARQSPVKEKAAPVRSERTTAREATPRPVTRSQPATAMAEPPLPRRVLKSVNPEDRSFRAGEIRLLCQFKGYGNPNAPIWIIGMEEQSELGTVELKHRLALDIFAEPYVSLPERLKLEQVPVELRFATPSWKVMAFIGLRFNDLGRAPTTAELEEYYREQFATPDGNLLISDILPLPAPAGNDWPYNRIEVADNRMVQMELRDRKLYTQRFLPERSSVFQSLYELRKERKNAPRYIFAYGKRYWNQYRKLFPFIYNEMTLETGKDGAETTVMLSRDNESGTWIVMLGSLNDQRGDVTNYLCDQLAQRLEAFSSR